LYQKEFRLNFKESQYWSCIKILRLIGKDTDKLSQKKNTWLYLVGFIMYGN
jgi:hypothetical protein